MLADRLAWTPAVGRWLCEDQYFTWNEADYKVKWDSAKALLSEVATTRPDFGGLETGLSTQSYRHLRRNANRTKDSFRSGVNSLGGVWHEVRTDSAFHVGELCVRCKAEPEDLSHIDFRCPHWHEERREVELPADTEDVPPCVKLHGFLPAPMLPAIKSIEPALVYRAGVATVWTDGSGRH
eukprot:1304966-Amphidinium_carterae.1